MSDPIEKNNKDNLRRFKAWLKKCFKDDWKYPEVFIEEMDIVIIAAAELKKDLKKSQRSTNG